MLLTIQVFRGSARLVLILLTPRSRYRLGLLHRDLRRSDGSYRYRNNSTRVATVAAIAVP